LTASSEGGDDVWSSDPYGRNFAGMPPTKSGDFAWVQHMIMSMTPRSGRMAVVLPHGALFRMGAEGKIRQNLKASLNAACQAEDKLKKLLKSSGLLPQSTQRSRRKSR
jgi:type I restriction-modification system DNA methylase subunit